MKDLIERLRGAERGLCTEDPYQYMARGVSAGHCIEAADLIQSQQSRIKELEGAFRLADTIACDAMRWGYYIGEELLERLAAARTTLGDKA